jgi:peptide/nickel transport system ATP-binding protein
MLKISNLTTFSYNTKTATFGRLIEVIDFRLERGEILAITGESGCGKTVTVLSMLGLIDFLPGIIEGEVLLTDKQGRTVNILDEVENVWELERQEEGVIIEKKKNAYIDWKKKSQNFLKKFIYGKEISIIFQDPRAHLTPYMSIGKQMEEVFTLHRKDINKHEIKDNIVQWLKDRVGLLDNIRQPGYSDLKKAYKTYSRALSGGMCQKVAIAMALASNPSVLIADEPTTGLDKVNEQDIVKLISRSREIGDNKNLSIILVTHDISLIKKLADRVIVMYGGQIVEEGPVNEIFSSGAVNHPYTARLRECMEVFLTDGGDGQLPTIEGEVYDPYLRFTSCRFGSRKCCPDFNSDCRKFAKPDKFVWLSESHRIKCHQGISHASHP